MAVRITAAAVSSQMGLISSAGNLSEQNVSLSSVAAAAEKRGKAVRVIDYSFDMLSYTICMEIKSCYTFLH